MSAIHQKCEERCLSGNTYHINYAHFAAAHLTASNPYHAGRDGAYFASKCLKHISLSHYDYLGGLQHEKSSQDYAAELSWQNHRLEILK
ncbi:MAG: hypothetical protein AAGM67_09825, partial [Bacteroidota bacterium]